MTKYNPQTIEATARKTEQRMVKLCKILKKQKPSDLDYSIRVINNKVFDKIDCKECANCCRTLGPRITKRDIEIISKKLNLTPNRFIDKYLKIDTDNDYIFNSTECPFINNDNLCSIYDFRPQACSAYPHLTHRKFVQILDLSLKNRHTCPAVEKAFELLEIQYNNTQYNSNKPRTNRIDMDIYRKKRR